MVKGKRRTNGSSVKDENGMVKILDGQKGPKDCKLETRSTMANSAVIAHKRENKITSYFSPSRSPPVADDAEFGCIDEILTNGNVNNFPSAQLRRSSDQIATPGHKMMNGNFGMSPTVAALITPPKLTVCTRSQALKQVNLQFPAELTTQSQKSLTPTEQHSITNCSSPTPSCHSEDDTSSLTGPPTPHKIQALNEEVLRLDSPLSPSARLSKLKLSLTPKKDGINGKAVAKVKRKLPTSAVSHKLSTQIPKVEKQGIKSGNGENKPVLRETQMTEFFPIRRSRRKPKTTLLQERQKDIEERIMNTCEEGLKIENFSNKGRGIVTTRTFAKGEFVVEYIGDLIDMKEAKDRERLYSQDASKGCYNYYFTFQNQQYCIDATEESGRFGRLVNHSRGGNLVPKAVEVNGQPHLVLLAKTDLEPNTEILYDYGDRSKESLMHHPWLAL